jgi:uncharacterized RDD family membrane protein YckC
LIAEPTPRVYDALGISPCSGDGTCFRMNDTYANGWPLVVLIAMCALYLVGVFVVQRGLTGRTIGSMLFMFEVVGEDLRPIGVGRAALRSLAGGIDYLPCCIPIVGVVTIAATPSRQRVGDLAAASIVIDARRNRSGSGNGSGNDTGIGNTPSAPETGKRVGVHEQLPSRPPTVTAHAPPRPPGPLWDPSREAYVLWDEAGERWLIFDSSLQQWIVLTEG